MNNNNFENIRNQPFDDKLNSLIGKLKELDVKNLKEMRRWQVIVGITTLLLIILIIINPMPIIIIDASVLLFFFVVYTLYYFKLSRKDYSVPIKKVLQDTRKTYSFLNPVFILTAVAIIPMLYASVHVMLTRYTQLEIPGISMTELKIGATFLLYAIIITLAYVTWHARFGKIVRKIDQTLSELGDNNLM